MGIGVSGPGINNGLFIQTGDPSTVDESTPFAIGQLGQVIQVSHDTLWDPGTPRTFQYVRRAAADGTTLGTNGSVAYWSDPEAFSVTMDYSEGYSAGSGSLNTVAGVFFAAYPATAGNYGFIQVAGLGPVWMIASPTTTPAIGLSLIGSTTDGRADCTNDWDDASNLFARVHSVLNADSVGTNVVQAELFPVRNGW
jgi:hypothetical protein